MMKISNKVLGHFASVVATSLMAVSMSHAATIPEGIAAFSKVVTSDVFTVKAKGWSDPAFGDMGWTHSSDWGTFTAEKGQTVTIVMTAADKGIHPGSTVWYRGDNDTAPDNYVVDHFYPQNANFAKFGATDEGDGTKLGNIIMKYVTHGYDLDKNTVTDAALKGKKDNVAGKLTLTFKAPYAGTYMFVVGGFNPDANITDDAEALKALHNVNVKVTVK
ncbi:MAG: copper(I)-binding protein CorA [Methylococcales bacterium]|nr:copper(I)-binding protein CorA [Methylococcales bacterium]MDD5754937.1 copper(I)-binding protein CorA [Methylococcales bacterium]